MLIIDGVKYNLWVPKEEKQLEEMVKEHAKEIFGKESVYFDLKQKLTSKSGIASIPDGYVISPSKPRSEKMKPFGQKRITNAIWRAMKAVGAKDRKQARKISGQVLANLKKHFGEEGVPTVEEIHDFVEKTLMEMGFTRTAKAYIV